MNFLVKCCVRGLMLWVFQLIGWVEIHKQLEVTSVPFLNQLLILGLVGFIFSLAIRGVVLVYSVFVFGTLGLGLVLLPLYMVLVGPLSLWLLMQLIPGWLVVSGGSLLLTILIGIVLSLTDVKIKVT